MNIGEQLSQAVRPTIALIFAISACIAFFIGRLNSDQWIGLAVMVISYYFATKTAEVASKRAPNRATDVVISNVEGNMNVPGNQLPPSPPTTSTRRKRKQRTVL